MNKISFVHGSINGERGEKLNGFNALWGDKRYEIRVN